MTESTEVISVSGRGQASTSTSRPPGSSIVEWIGEEVGLGVALGVAGRAAGGGGGAGVVAVRPLAAGALLLLVVGRGRDLEREQGHVARLERAAQLVAVLREHPRGLGRVGHDLRGDAGGRGLQADLDAAELGGPERHLGVRDAAVVRDAEQRRDGGGCAVQRHGALRSGRRGGRGGGGGSRSRVHGGGCRRGRGRRRSVGGRPWRRAWPARSRSSRPGSARRAGFVGGLLGRGRGRVRRGLARSGALGLGVLGHRRLSVVGGHVAPAARRPAAERRRAWPASAPAGRARAAAGALCAVAGATGVAAGAVSAAGVASRGGLGDRGRRRGLDGDGEGERRGRELGEHQRGRGRRRLGGSGRRGVGRGRRGGGRGGGGTLGRGVKVVGPRGTARVEVVAALRAAIADIVAAVAGVVAARRAVVAADGRVAGAGGRGVGVEERREGVPRRAPLRRGGGAVGRGRGRARGLGAVGGHHRIEGVGLEAR